MNIFFNIGSFPLAEGFGIQTNIFETNVINLAVVIAVVVFFVGKNLSSLLEDRQNTILKNLQEAKNKALEAQERLNKAISQLESAKKKAEDIRQEGISRVDQAIQSCTNQHEERLSKLDDFKEETLQFYQQKALKQAYMYVISRIMTRVRERLNSGLDDVYHVTVNNFYVSRFTEYNP
uniref:ATP synthase subunit b, chloroplastic n=1 Tax=Jenufa perforata TaxID=993091 RepID=A0A0S2LND6_9CHLO|nr:CF0 subunit I of ATP synthase [Jenufa perforata]ALO62846.1 CF0 subunit I of ATP synthase [Jenufa perforata]